MWFTKTTSRVTRLFKSSDAVFAMYEGFSPAVSSLRLVLAKDDARRARASKENRAPLLRSRKNGVVTKKTVESHEVVKSDCDDEQDGLLAIGPEVFEEENPVGNVVGVKVGVKVAATTCEDVLDELMHVGPEVFEGDRVKDMGFGEECLNANGPAGVGRSRTSKEDSVQHWIDSMKFMGKDEGIQGGTTATGGDGRYLYHRHTAFTAKGLTHDCAAEFDVLSVIEEVDEMDTSEDDDKTVITAIEVPIQNDPETRFHGDSSGQGLNEDLPALLDTLDEPDLPDMDPEEDMPVATFTIKEKTSKSASDGGEIDPVSAMIADIAQQKARCNPVTPPRHHPVTEAWSGDSPTLLEIQDDSEFRDTMPETDELPATLKSNKKRDVPTADSKASDFAAAMKGQNTGTEATVEAQIASSCANVNALPKRKEQKIENETTTIHSNAEDLSQALVVEDMKAKRGLDDTEGNIVPSRARMREDLIAQVEKNLASQFYVSAGQSHTKEIKIGRMEATQTTECGHAMTATNEDSNLITGGLRTASKMEATVQSTPISLETTHEAWLVMHKPDREAYVAAHRAIIDYDVADIELEVAANRAAYRSELEQEKEKFHSRLDIQLEELEAKKAQLKAEIADSGKKSASVQGQTTFSSKQETEDLERRWWQVQFTARKNAEMAAMADEADAYLSDLDSELQYTKDLLNTTINERDEALRAVHTFNLAVSRDTCVLRMQSWNIAQLDVQVMEANSKAEKLENENRALRMALSTAETAQLSGYQWPWNWRRSWIESQS